MIKLYIENGFEKISVFLNYGEAPILCDGVLERQQPMDEWFLGDVRIGGDKAWAGASKYIGSARDMEWGEAVERSIAELRAQAQEKAAEAA
jgi:hypothetical protein